MVGPSRVVPQPVRFLSLRFGWRAWLAMFGVLGAVNVIAWYVPELFGAEWAPMLLPSVFVFSAWWLLMVFLGGGQEEAGWRGYILESLEARFGLWGGNVVLGAVWSVWHLPLWFVDGTSQASMPFAAFTMGTQERAALRAYGVVRAEEGTYG